VNDELRKQFEAARERSVRLAEETQRLANDTRRILDVTRNRWHALFARRAVYEIERIKAKARAAS